MGTELLVSLARVLSVSLLHSFGCVVGLVQRSAALILIFFCFVIQTRSKVYHDVIRYTLRCVRCGLYYVMSHAFHLVFVCIFQRMFVH